MKKDSTPETELLDKIFGLDREEEPLSAHETLEGGRTLREIKTWPVDPEADAAFATFSRSLIKKIPRQVIRRGKKSCV